MVIFIIGNDVCFGGKCLKVLESRCKGERSNIALVQWDGPNKLSFPGEQNVVVLGDA